MSEYFRVLKRIEAERSESTGTYRPLRLATSKPAGSRETARREAAPAVERAVVQSSAPGFASLFDNLRARTEGQSLQSLVVAAVAGEPVGALIGGLAAHARGLGLSVLTAQLVDSHGRAALRCDTASGELTSSVDLLPEGAESEAATAALVRRLRTEHDADVLLIEGKPLAESIDAAVLAKACDGLVVVAQTRTTEIAELQAAAERARAVGCSTLGLVIDTTRDPTPDWVRRTLARLPG